MTRWTAGTRGMSVATVCNRSSSSKADGGNKKSKHSNNLEHTQTARDNTPTRPLILRCPSAVTRAAAAAPVLCRRPPAIVTEKAKMIKAPPSLLSFCFFSFYICDALTSMLTWSVSEASVGAATPCRQTITPISTLTVKPLEAKIAHMTNIKQTFNLRSEMPLSLSSVECGRVCFCELATSTAAFLFAECTATM